MDMEGIGMYEGYTHMANIFLTGGSEELQQNIWEILEQEPECDGGVTKLVQNDLAVRSWILNFRKASCQRSTTRSISQLRTAVC